MIRVLPKTCFSALFKLEALTMAINNTMYTHIYMYIKIQLPIIYVHNYVTLTILFTNSLKISFFSVKSLRMPT